MICPFCGAVVADGHEAHHEAWHNTVAHKPKKATPKPVYTVTLDREARAWMGIPAGMVDNWCRAYPGANIPAEMERALLWAISNPAQDKKNWLRYLTNWFARAQERSRPTPSSGPGVSRKPWRPPDDNMTICYGRGGFHHAKKADIVRVDERGRDICRVCAEAMDAEAEPALIGGEGA